MDPTESTDWGAEDTAESMREKAQEIAVSYDLLVMFKIVMNSSYAFMILIVSFLFHCDFIF